MRGAQTCQHEVINPLVTAWKRKDNIVPFVKRKSFFLLRMCHLLFLLETSGSFCKFNSFLFIYLSIFLKFNFRFFIYLFVPYIYCVYTRPEVNQYLCFAQSAVFCSGVRPTSRSVLDMTLNNLMVKFQWCWSFGECGVSLHCHHFQVHSGPEW